MTCRFVKTENYLFLIGEKYKSDIFPYIVLEISENIKPELVQVTSSSEYKDNQYEILLHKPINHSELIDSLKLMDISLF